MQSKKPDKKLGPIAHYRKRMELINRHNEIYAKTCEKYIFRKEFDIEHCHTDRFGRAKPSALLYFAQEAAAEHCQLLQVDDYFLKDKNLFWAISRTRVKIDRLPHKGETITVETWPMPTSRVAYPRAVAAYDSHGGLLFETVSLWVLMDRTTRKLVLPEKSGVTVDGYLFDNELAIPRAIATVPMEHSVTRQVGFSLLDQNGHMNNTRYFDWLIDLLPSEFHREKVLTDCVISYMDEAREGDEITLHYALRGKGVLTVDAHRQDGRIFSAQLSYGDIL